MISVLLATSVYGGCDESCNCLDNRKEAVSDHISARYLFGNGIGFDKDYASIDLLLAPQAFCDYGFLFFDGRAHFFTDGKFASNIGLGGRRWCECWDIALGGNIFYDYRKTSKGHYNQLGVGIEFIDSCWDIHLNGYIPLGKRKSSLFSTNTSGVLENVFAGHNFLIHEAGEIVLKGKREFSMGGLDLLLGFSIYQCDSMLLKGSVGPYFFSGYYGQNAIGAEAKATLDYRKYLSFEIGGSYDNIFKGRGHAQIAINFPLGPSYEDRKRCAPCCCTPCFEENLANKLVERVDRNEIIPIRRINRKYSQKVDQLFAINPTTGLPWVFWFVDNQSSSDGTFESPYPTLAQAESSSSQNEVIYVFPGDGTTKGMQSGITLKDDQKLFGAGMNHLLETADGTITIPAQATGMPKILGLGTSLAGVVCASNNEIAGIEVSNALSGSSSLSIAILLNNVTNSNIHDNFIRAQSIVGVNFVNCEGDIHVSNNRFALSGQGSIGGQEGILFDPSVGNAAYLIASNYFSGSFTLGSQGVELGEFFPLGDFNTITFFANQFERVGSAEVGGKPIGGFGFGGTGQLILDSNVFIDCAFDNQPGMVHIDSGGFADIKAQIINNIWQGSQDPSVAALYVETSDATSKLCLILKDNVTSTAIEGYVLNNINGGTFIADISGNYGAVTEIGTITPGSCP